MTDEYIKKQDAVMTAMDYGGIGNAQDASQDIASALIAIPAADVRPVVRCKDCVYHYYAVDCAGMCELGIGSALLDDDFCSRGTRKSGAKMDGGQDDA